MPFQRCSKLFFVGPGGLNCSIGSLTVVYALLQ